MQLPCTTLPAGSHLLFEHYITGARSSLCWLNTTMQEHAAASACVLAGSQLQLQGKGQQAGRPVLGSRIMRMLRGICPALHQPDPTSSGPRNARRVHSIVRSCMVDQSKSLEVSSPRDPLINAWKFLSCTCLQPVVHIHTAAPAQR